MITTYIKLSNTIKAHYSYEASSSFTLEHPSFLPDCCEECGAYKDSSYEIRLIYLIPFYDPDFYNDRFLCEKCFLQANAKHHGKTKERIKRENSIIVTRFIEKGSYEYFLKEPCLPDGCEECGAHKGSSFENRIMNLICFNGQQDGQFLCEECFVKIKPTHLDRQLVDGKAVTNIRF